MSNLVLFGAVGYFVSNRHAQSVIASFTWNAKRCWNEDFDAFSQQVVIQRHQDPIPWLFRNLCLGEGKPPDSILTLIVRI